MLLKITKVPQMTNAPITIQTAISNGLIERYSSTSEFWGCFADVCTALVVVGVFAEVLELAPKFIEAGLGLKWNCLLRRKSAIEPFLAWAKENEHWLDVCGIAFWTRSKNRCGIYANQYPVSGRCFDCAKHRRFLMS